MDWRPDAAKSMIKNNSIKVNIYAKMQHNAYYGKGVSLNKGKKSAKPDLCYSPQKERHLYIGIGQIFSYLKNTYLRVEISLYL